MVFHRYASCMECNLSALNYLSERIPFAYSRTPWSSLAYQNSPCLSSCLIDSKMLSLCLIFNSLVISLLYQKAHRDYYNTTVKPPSRDLLRIAGFSTIQYNTTVKPDRASPHPGEGFSTIQYNTTVKPQL